MLLIALLIIVFISSYSFNKYMAVADTGNTCALFNLMALEQLIANVVNCIVNRVHQ